ncbi:FMN-binding negative transcriptional regulator [Niveispirillum fermenti]|uniref:FMN-binding negative transcriptional regulator n=1 Tax=Niveispirillum fermenti TaxID=1233113 RepID=UPI003A88FC21
MYIPDAFTMEMQAALDLIDHRPLATLVSLGDGGLLSTLLPLLRERGADGLRLTGHVARANPHWRRFDPGVPSLALFQGGDGYVSPSWYLGKAIHHKVVPTWNYLTVHVHGRLEVVEDPDAVLAIVSRLTDRQEMGREVPWKVADAPADFIAANLRAIVGLVLHVDKVEGKAKLSQNRPEADRAGVRAGLSGVLEIP